MKTAEEIKAEIERIEDERQYLNMKDFWSWKDKEKDQEMYRQLSELRNELAKVEE